MNTRTQDLMNDAGSIYDDAKENIGDAAESATEKASSLRDTVTEKVSDAAAKLRDGAADRIEATRDAITDSGDRLADTLRRAADSTEGGTLQSRVLSAAADGLQTVASELRTTNFSQMSTDIQAYAQRNPLVFAAGAAVAGFMIARMVRASAQP